MSLLTNCFKLGSIVMDKNYCMTSKEMRNIDPSLYPNVFPIWCSDDNCLYMMYKQKDGTVKIENLKEMDWTDNPTILYPVIKNGKLTWELKYISGMEEIPEVNIIGKSAYEIWKDLGNEGTEEDFINSLRAIDGQDGQTPIIEIGSNGNWYVNNVDTGASAKGDKGDPGKSAYEIWKESDESNVDKTEADFLASLKGEKGTDGVDGEKGIDGVSPHIGANGNWFIGDYDTNTAAHGEDGTDGINGKSAYEIWKDLGNEGSEDDFITYLKGETGLSGKSVYEVWKEQGNDGSEADFLASLKGEPGEAGIDGEDGSDGLDGKSAYEIWKTIEGNEDKTETEFIESLKGEKGEPGTAGVNGEDGTDGINGKSAYEIWKESDESNVDKTEADFLASLKGEKGTDGVDGINGKSAYEIWKTIEGNEDKTEEEFLASLKDKSLYNSWIEAGNTGSEEDFVNSIINTQELANSLLKYNTIWEINTAYNAGAYVMYGGKLYCTIYGNSGSESLSFEEQKDTEKKWIEISIYKYIESSLKELNNYKTFLDVIFPKCDETKSYKQYDIVRFNDNGFYMWTKTEDSTPGDFNDKRPDRPNGGWVSIVNSYGDIPFNTLRGYISLII